MENNISKNLKFRYRRLWIFSVLLMCIVSLAPLIIITYANYNQYEEVYTEELNKQVTHCISSIKQTMEYFINERLSALNLLINEKTFEELSDTIKCTQLLSNLKKSFEGFIDLGLIDSKGNHRSYSGPYELVGKNYKDQHWFDEVSLRGFHVSEVFLGFRKFPHFVIAVKHEKSDGDFYILRATLNTEILNKKIHSHEFGTQSDVFIINGEGILQTPSLFYGKILEKCKLDVPLYIRKTSVKREKDNTGKIIIFGSAYLENSPFILIVIRRSEDFLASLFEVRIKLRWYLIFSIFLIASVILGSTAYMVRRIYKADLNQVEVLHNMEYTNKMASIGRLAAGVAHEINNPLAIINESAGLLKDFATLKSDFNYKDKILNGVESILKSVDRCSTITHRLLGFAKRMDINKEVIDLELLLKEVIGFLEKEAIFRDIKIDYNIAENLPSVESDRGQLQQVFLNIITNAFYAVEDNGQINISAVQKNSQFVEIYVSDNGEGIAKENLENIFEPFFTTKGKYGTGLGLSITYGIVEKLGGDITVKSTLGEGTRFTIQLPIKLTSI